MPILTRFAVLAVLAAPLGALDVAPPGSVRTGAHYRVVCHFENDAVANAVLETAETVWVIAAELCGERAPAPDKPLAIHLSARPANTRRSRSGLRRVGSRRTCPSRITRPGARTSRSSRSARTLSSR